MNTKPQRIKSGTITGTVVADSVRYGKTSAVGNTSKIFTVRSIFGQEFTVETAANSSYGYTIGNAEYRDGAYAFHFNGWGLVNKIVPIKA